MTTRTCSSRSFIALMLAQFFGALNDNLFKVMAALILLHTVVEESGKNGYLSFVNVVFVLPFIFFSALAGSLADRFSKSRLTRWVKIAEILVMGLAMILLFSREPYSLLVILFLVGLHSTIFSPVKYGIIPELLSHSELSRGNGFLQFWTFIAIIFGTALGGALMDFSTTLPWLPGASVVFFAVLGYVASNFIAETEAQQPDTKLEFNSFAPLKEFTSLKQDRWLLLAVLAISYFWALGSLYQLNIVLYGKTHLGALSDLSTSLLVAALGIGIGLGSVMAGIISEGKVELGLVPLGALGLAIASILLACLDTSYAGAMILLFGLGISAGFYIVPLNSFLQERSPSHQRGRYVALSNLIAFSGMLFCALMLHVLTDYLSFSPAAVFAVFGTITLIIAVYICFVLPEMLIRCLNWVLTHTIYRLRVVGQENVPLKGGALLVCNHMSFADASILLASLERPVRFLMFRPIYEHILIRPFAKTMGAIPVEAGGKKTDIEESLRGAREAILRGELVCIFPEGAITRVGQLQKFKRGFERIMAGTDAPIIPAHLDQLWGSIFSFRGKRFFFKRPREFPYPVTVSFGPPLASTASAFQARQAVQELGVTAFRLRRETSQILHQRTLAALKGNIFKKVLSDSMGVELRGFAVIGGILAFSKAFRSYGSPGDKVGIHLPSSVSAAIANVALLMAGRIPVNINFTASKEALLSTFAQCEMKWVVTAERFMEKSPLPLSESGPSTIFLEEIQASLTPQQKLGYALQAIFFPLWLLRKLYSPEPVHAEDCATVMFSSGSTGLPKGVVLTHRNICANVTSINEIFEAQNDECVLGVLPFFHSFGCTATMWFPLLAGIRAAYHFNPLDASGVGKLAEKHGGTLLFATPTFLQLYLRKCTTEQFKTLREVLVGAEKLSEKLCVAFEEKCGVSPKEGYGCTELSPLALVNTYNYGEGREAQKGWKPGTVGLPIPGVAARIVDPETFEPKSPNEPGLLLISGANVMKGYLGQPEKTAEVIRDGWYVTGDIATIDDDGFIAITDRLSRFSKIGGEMVPHLKLEEEIQEILGSEERILAVTGVPDEKKGERLVVLLTREVDVSSINKQLNERGLPNLWIPRPENYFVVPEIPLLGTGKVDLKGIKERAKLLSEAAGAGAPGQGAPE